MEKLCLVQGLENGREGGGGSIYRGSTAVREEMHFFLVVHSHVLAVFDLDADAVAALGQAVGACCWSRQSPELRSGDWCYLEQDGRSRLHGCGEVWGDARVGLLPRPCPSSVARQVSPPEELPLPGALRGLLRSRPTAAAGRRAASPSRVLPCLVPPLALLIVALAHAPVPRPGLLGLADHAGRSSGRSGVLWPEETKGEDMI